MIRWYEYFEGYMKSNLGNRRTSQLHRLEFVTTTLATSFSSPSSLEMQDSAGDKVESLELMALQPRAKASSSSSIAPDLNTLESECIFLNVP